MALVFKFLGINQTRLLQGKASAEFCIYCESDSNAKENCWMSKSDVEKNIADIRFRNDKRQGLFDALKAFENQGNSFLDVNNWDDLLHNAALFDKKVGK